MTKTVVPAGALLEYRVLALSSTFWAGPHQEMESAGVRL